MDNLKLKELKEISKDTFKPATQNPWDSFQAKTKTSNLILDKTIDIKNEASILIYNLNRKESINFNLVPETLADTYKAKFTTESNIYGRTTPLYFYSGGDGKSLSLSFSIHEDLLPKITDNKSTNLYTFLETLRSYTMPDFLQTSKGQTIKGPEIYLQIGSHFAGKGYFTIDWAYRLPYRNGRYIVADVNISFTYIVEYDIPQVQLLEEDTGSTVLIDKILEDTAIANELENFLESSNFGFIKEYAVEVEQLLGLYNYDSFNYSIAEYEQYLIGSSHSFDTNTSNFVNMHDHDTGRIYNPYDLFLMYYINNFYNFLNDDLQYKNEIVFDYHIINKNAEDINSILKDLDSISYKLDILSMSYKNTDGSYTDEYGKPVQPSPEWKASFEKRLVNLQALVTNTRHLLQNLLGGRS